jgi:hypothetical protein
VIACPERTGHEDAGRPDINMALPRSAAQCRIAIGSGSGAKLAASLGGILEQASRPG